MQQLSVKKWGNSLGVRIPKVIANSIHLKENNKVNITTINNSVVITPVEEKFLTLDERLQQFDSTKHAGEVMNDELIGAEKW